MKSTTTVIPARKRKRFYIVAGLVAAAMAIAVGLAWVAERNGPSVGGPPAGGPP